MNINNEPHLPKIPDRLRDQLITQSNQLKVEMLGEQAIINGIKLGMHIVDNMKSLPPLEALEKAIKDVTKSTRFQSQAEIAYRITKESHREG